MGSCIRREEGGGVCITTVVPTSIQTLTDLVPKTKNPRKGKVESRISSAPLHCTASGIRKILQKLLLREKLQNKSLV